MCLRHADIQCCGRHATQRLGCTAASTSPHAPRPSLTTRQHGGPRRRRSTSVKWHGITFPRYLYSCSSPRVKDALLQQVKPSKHSSQDTDRAGRGDDPEGIIITHPPARTPLLTGLYQRKETKGRRERIAAVQVQCRCRGCGASRQIPSFKARCKALCRRGSAPLGAPLGAPLDRATPAVP